MSRQYLLNAKQLDGSGVYWWLAVWHFSSEEEYEKRSIREQCCLCLTILEMCQQPGPRFCKRRQAIGTLSPHQIEAVIAPP